MHATIAQNRARFCNGIGDAGSGLDHRRSMHTGRIRLTGIGKVTAAAADVCASRHRWRGTR
jgi:hypothetical protein